MDLSCRICLDTLADPVLVSDGWTYCRECIVAAMTQSPEKLSPITGEMLRGVAVRNRYAAALLGDAADDDAHFLLYKDLPCSDAWFTVKVKLPDRLCYAKTLVKLKWGLHARAELRVDVKVDAGLKQWRAMHFPVASNAEADVRELVAAFGLDGKLINPTHVGNAVLKTGAETTTVEKQWIASQAKT